MLLRLVPFALMLLVLNGCALPFSIDYDEMDDPAPIDWANGVVIDLDTRSDARLEIEVDVIIKYSAGPTRPINETLFDALQTELENRGFTIGKGPGAVPMLAKIVTVKSYPDPSVYIDRKTIVGFSMRVLGPGPAQYFKAEYHAQNNVKGTRYQHPYYKIYSIAEAISRALTEAVHKAVTDEFLFDAIRKAHDDTAAQSALTPASSLSARPTGNSGS